MEPWSGARGNPEPGIQRPRRNRAAGARVCWAPWLPESPQKAAVPPTPTHVGGNRANAQDPGQQTGI